MLKKFLLGVSVVSMMSVSASAADMIEPIADTSWTGAYIGLVGGYGWGDVDATSDVSVVVAGPAIQFVGISNDSVDADGVLLGGQVGFDVDAGNGLVIGLAGDMSWSDMEGDTCIEGAGCVPPSPDDSYAEVDVNWLATVRARAGFATGDLLVYATGGVAFADVDAYLTFIDGPADPSRNDSKTHIGWVVGGGAEFRVMENMSIGAEYLYVDLGDENYDLPGVDPTVVGSQFIETEADITAHIVRGSLNFRF